MLTLYHSKNARSVRVRQLLIELGLPFELERVKIHVPAAETPVLAEVSSLRRVPVLTDGDLVMIESIAIMEYILGKHAPDSPLAARPADADYGDYLKWLHFAEAGLAVYAGQLMRHTILAPEEERLPAMVDYAIGKSLDSLNYVSSQLGDREYLLERGFSAADIAMSYPLLLLKFGKVIGQAPENIQAYAARVFDRPSWKEATAD
ncbi:MAG: glutathione S-transferase family protein [Maricaulaceae bacterium]|jgi:glutathione S-transferase